MVNTITVWMGSNGEVPIWYAPRGELEEELSHYGDHPPFFPSVNEQKLKVISAIKAELQRRDKIWEKYHAYTQGQR